jgi:hypothetical protein
MKSVLRGGYAAVSLVSAVLIYDLVETPLAAASITRGPYLQQGTTNTMVVRWRTDVATDSAVAFGVIPGSFTDAVSDEGFVTEHIVSIPNLQPDTKYYYRFGDSGAWFPSDTNQFFITLPPVGAIRPIRIWALGDSGTANSQAAAARDAYTAFNGGRLTDVWLMLGDNAYGSGTDTEYQNAVFNFYPAYLQHTVLWPTIGNHDSYSGGTYLNIFTLPQNAEAGGVPSGTENYYSFDYANIHFICLDSAMSSRAIGGAMYTWAEADLQATAQDWIIVFFHHPPYTKGSHNSDVEGDLIEMRQNFNPLLEEHGVDLVLCGHSHGYERSFLLDGHYGGSTTFAEAMKKDGGNGRTNGSGVYQKPSGTLAHQGTVYTVAGSSGQASSGNPYNHPAMYISMGVIGSTVIDVNSNRLDLTFLKADATAGDYFTILKAPAPPPDTNPPAAPTALLATAVSSNRINLSWTDHATNEQGFKLERSTNGTDFVEFITVAAGTTSFADIGLMPNGTYHYRVRAYNSSGDSAYANVAQATTFAGPPPDLIAPAAITNLDIPLQPPSFSSRVLRWSAPGDDGNSGFNAGGSYDVRYSTDPIDSNNWSLATQAAGEHAPGPPGALESFTVSNLAPNQLYYFAIRTSDEANNISELSNITNSMTLPAPDTTPPAAVTNLQITALNVTSATLSWKAPGDDGNVGTAASYDVRYRTNAITSNNWSTATLAVGEPAPAIAGTTQSFTVTGLAPNRTYYFALRSSDETTTNISQLSNVASGTTPPVDTNAPAAVTNLLVSVVTSNSVVLSWNAPGDDGTNGTATTYDVRWRTNFITASNWATATQVTGEPAPALAGTFQSLSITGLSPGRTYYFALKTSDEVTNISPLSNVPDATTLSARSAGIGIATLIPSNSVWKYLDNGSNQGTNWAARSFNDNGWTSGVAKLGYGGQGEATVVSYGPSSSSKYITTYFRRHFNVSDPSVLDGLNLAVVRDDGVVVYLNGHEVFRNNMPGETINYLTVAATNTGGSGRAVFLAGPLITNAFLFPGDNVIAAEVHLRNSSSTTMGFNLELKGTLAVPAVQISKASPGQFVLRWPSFPGKRYRVLYTDILPATGWTNSGTDIFAMGYSSATTNAPATNQQRFFRVQLLD